jgi:HEAT repeat protein/beta-lactamase regulating signal transducer with metallopeptidase domain
MTLLSLPIVVDAVAKASVILAATALGAAALRRASASARHLVWTLGLLSALAAPALSLALPRWELPIVTVAAPTHAADRAIATPAPGTRVNNDVAARENSLQKDASQAQSPLSRSSAASDPVSLQSRLSAISWPSLALFIWIAGAAVVLGRMVVGILAVLWMSRRTPVVADAPWLDEAQALAWMLELRNVRFLRGGAGTMPMAWGILRPSVVMPADADTWPVHRLRVVLLHELAHVKRRDCLTHLVAQLACAAYWFNPLAWMAARRLRTERERACDDLVLAAGTRGSDYADQLLDIARVMRAGRFPAIIAGASLAMAHRSQLEGRLMAILDPTVPRRGLTRARAAAAAVAFAIFIVPVASVQPWAEERTAINAAVADAPYAQQRQTQLPQPSQPAEKPYESYPGQANADNRQNAANQDDAQGNIQNTVQGAVQGTVQGAVQGAIQGAQAGVEAGIQGGVRRGVKDGVPGGIVGGAITAVADGIADGIAGGVASVAHEVAMAHEQTSDRDRDRDKDRDKDRQSARDPRTVNALMEALKDSDKDVRETALHALVQMRDPRIFEPLVVALRDSNADVREQAAFGLGQLRDPKAVEPLSAAIKDSNASVREQVVFALGQLRAAGAIDAITIALHDSSDDVREQAAFALGQIRDRRAVDPLISALKDQKANVREQAAFALGQLRDTKAVDALVIAIKDSDTSVREQVVFALGQIRDPRAIDGLTTALKDASAQVRQQAAFALGQIR